MKRKYFFVFIFISFVIEIIIAICILNNISTVKNDPIKINELAKEIDSLADAGNFASLASDYFDRNGLKNLAKLTETSPKTMTGVTYTKNSSGTITVNGTNTGSAASYYFCTIVDQNYFKPGKYILSGVPNVEGLSLQFRYNTGSNISLALVNAATPTAEFEIT